GDESAGDHLGEVTDGGDGAVVTFGGHAQRTSPHRPHQILHLGEVGLGGTVGGQHPGGAPEQARCGVFGTAVFAPGHRVGAHEASQTPGGGHHRTLHAADVDD